MSSVDRIFQIMEDRKLTSAFVSKQTGISAGNFTDWKKGRSKPGAKTINRLAEFFGVSSDYLLGRSDDPLPPVDMKDVTIVKESYVGPLDPAEKEWLESVLAAYREKIKQDGQ